MAKAVSHPSIAERIGRFAGRAWQGGVRGQKRFALWLTSKGAPASLASALPLLVAVAVLGAVTYIAFWLALLAVIAVGAAWIARNSDTQEQPQPEWRNGWAGFGLYRGEVRVDPGGPDDEL